jgi:hypothetical protein
MSLGIINMFQLREENMASTKLIFNADEVQRLRTKIGQVSQDTNPLYLQLRGQANSWSGIPLGQNLCR